MIKDLCNLPGQSPCRPVAGGEEGVTNALRQKCSSSIAKTSPSRNIFIKCQFRQSECWIGWIGGKLKIGGQVGKQKLASKQYNSPMAMYSEDVLEEIMQQVIIITQ